MNSPPSVVFVVDGNPEVRQSLRWLLSKTDAEVATFAAPTPFFAEYSPDRVACVVVGLRLPEMSGLALMQRLRQEDCPTPVVLYSEFGDVPTVRDAFTKGAFAFVSKEEPNQMLFDAVQEALRFDGLQKTFRRKQLRFCDRRSRLTDGERQVVDGLVLGRSYKEIAADLGVSYKTVEARRAKAFKKLGVDNVVELVRESMEVACSERPCRFCGVRGARLTNPGLQI